jgi:hypothetical protein
MDDSAALTRQVLFGFDRAYLYVRVDLSRPVQDAIADGYDMALRFVSPAGVTLRREGDLSSARPAGVQVGLGQVIEWAVPVAALGAAPGDSVAFFVVVLEPRGGELERHPAHRPIEVTVPDDRFEALNWRA